MPASRPSWKGYIKLALVSCPVSLWPATSPSERIAFRQINTQTGNRIRYQSVDEGTREPVDTAYKGKGYEVEKDQFIMVDDAELKSIQIESTKTIEIDAFVPRAEIDERFLDSPYYIAPSDKVGAEAFAIIREAMRDKDMAALARVVLTSREHVIMLQPWDKGMLGITLRYPYELRDPDRLLSRHSRRENRPATAGSGATHSPEQGGRFRPEPLRRPLRAGGDRTARDQAKGAAANCAARHGAGTAYRSHGGVKEEFGKGHAAGERRQADKGRQEQKRANLRDPAQREMLLPISGKKGAQAEEAKPQPKRLRGARQGDPMITQRIL